RDERLKSVKNTAPCGLNKTSWQSRSDNYPSCNFLPIDTVSFGIHEQFMVDQTPIGLGATGLQSSASTLRANGG
ncbi:MAG: hypothetical protein ABJ360_11195, partial [Roseobacter sp.]